MVVQLVCKQCTLVANANSYQAQLSFANGVLFLVSCKIHLLVVFQSLFCTDDQRYQLGERKRGVKGRGGGRGYCRQKHVHRD